MITLRTSASRTEVRMDAKEFGEWLQKLRALKVVKLKGGKTKVGATLREVEEATGIKNAYLSLLELGKIAKPHPQKLQKLAEYYEKPYEQFLYMAGYLVKQSLKEKNFDMPMNVEAYFMAAKLDEDEWKKLADFHDQFVRKKRTLDKD